MDFLNDHLANIIIVRRKVILCESISHNCHIFVTEIVIIIKKTPFRGVACKILNEFQPEIIPQEQCVPGRWIITN